MVGMVRFAVGDDQIFGFHFVCSFIHCFVPSQDCVLTECNVAPGVVIEAGSKLAGEFLTLENDDDETDEEDIEA